MIKTDEIIQKIERYASLDLMEPWDNSGWQINLCHDYTNKVLVALSLTKETLVQAITNDCDLIITHHPLIFDRLSAINDSVIIEAIKHNISVYSAHTNLAGVLGLKNLITVDDYIKISHLKDEIALEDFLDNAKIALGVERIKLINPSGVTTVKNIAICAGAGGSYIKKIRDYDVDLYITGDIKFHAALEVRNFATADIGHFESEVPVLPLLQGLISKAGVEAIIADEHVPWTYI